MRITYNAPVVLTFAGLSFIVLVLDMVSGGLLNHFLSAPTSLSTVFGTGFLGVVGHPLAHANFAHYGMNMLYIVPFGAVLEEKYGSMQLLIMMLVTAAVTGVLNAALLNTGLVGASGLVFMFLLLASVVLSRYGEIPLTLIVVAGIYLVPQVLDAFKSNNVSQFGHLIGGGVGAMLGLMQRKDASAIRTVP